MVHQAGFADAAIAEDDDLGEPELAYTPETHVDDGRAGAGTFRSTFFLEAMVEEAVGGKQDGVIR